MRELEIKGIFVATLNMGIRHFTYKINFSAKPTVIESP